MYNISHFETLNELFFFHSIPIHPGRPFDLAVFEDRLWISDQEHQQLRSVHKWTGKKLQRIHSNMVQPASIVVVHPLAKPGTKRKYGIILEIHLFRNDILRFRNITCDNSSTRKIKGRITKWTQVERLSVEWNIFCPSLASTASLGADVCLHLNGGCAQVCESRLGFAHCSCLSHYILSADGKSCMPADVLKGVTGDVF